MWRMRRGMRHRLDRAGQRVDLARRALLSPAEQLALARERLVQLGAALRRATGSAVSERRWQLSHFGQRLQAAKPDVAAERQRLANIRKALSAATMRRLAAAHQATAQWHARLVLLDPQRTLERGYAIATLPDGGVVRTSDQLDPGVKLNLRLAAGRASLTVDEASQS
jgi:exodeoxyribonuclease VII large subunit